MKITEIITNPIRDEYIDHKAVYFSDAQTVAKIRNLLLKKTMVEDELWYGLFDPNNPIQNCLVGLLQLQPYKSYWQVVLVQIAQTYKSQEYGTFLYDYAVMNDSLTLLSDVTNSVDMLGGSEGLWKKLYKQGRYKVCGYNLCTDTILPNVTPVDGYNQKEDIVWAATPKEHPESINEMLTRINSNNTHRTVVWYGPTIVPKDHF